MGISCGLVHGGKGQEAQGCGAALVGGMLLHGTDGCGCVVVSFATRRRLRSDASQLSFLPVADGGTTLRKVAVDASQCSFCPSQMAERRVAKLLSTRRYFLFCPSQMAEQRFADGELTLRKVAVDASQQVVDVLTPQEPCLPIELQRQEQEGAMLATKETPASNVGAGAGERSAAKRRGRQ